ncbi:MAG: tellurium resistance protein TerC [Planctomycetaceae bacterium]|nr:tellurium resistance protein TerC [Planctomycetaceae bacterium]
MLLAGAIVVLGAILIPLPGPGSLVLACGLAVLGVEFVWARDWLKSLQNFARSLAGRRNEPSPPEGM